MGENADQTAGEKIGLDAQIEQPRDGAGRVVGMKGAEDKVPGERGLNRHHGGFVIADFADHDDVRILPQHAAQAAREGHAFFIAYLRLTDARQPVFDWVFERDDIFFVAVDLLKGGVERCRLAAACGTRDKDQAVIDVDEPVRNSVCGA